MDVENNIPEKSKKLNPEFFENVCKLKNRINEFEKNFAVFENSIQKLKFSGHDKVTNDRNWKIDGM